MLAPRFQPFEKLRRIWTPDREIEEFKANLNPGSALDSEIRDYFCRIVADQGVVNLDITDPLDPSDDIRWEIVHTPEGRRLISIWYIKGERNGE
jgi:hypothetical protein